MKINTAILTGVALDWAVAKAEGLLEPKEFFGKMVAPVVLDMEYWTDGTPIVRLNPCPDVYYRAEYDPSTDWKHGGPIIEHERINVHCVNDSLWEASCPAPDGVSMQNGPTPLIAAMRCYVAAVLGNFVDIPEELA